MSRSWRVCFVLCFVLLLSFASNAKPGPRKSVALRLNAVSVAPHLEKEQDLERRFRALVLSGLRRLDVKPQAAYSLSTALVELSSKRRERRVETDCIVSATLHDAPGGALRAVLRGKASVRTLEPDSDARHEALESAVNSALRQVAEALKQTQKH